MTTWAVAMAQAKAMDSNNSAVRQDSNNTTKSTVHVPISTYQRMYGTQYSVMKYITRSFRTIFF